MECWLELLHNTDILIDGRFEIEKKNLNLRFRGSENQRVIDVRKTELNKKIILAEWD
ncbi:radical SAM protein [Alkaliphilus sp. MSJ-5]|uniref:Radical SAM protein n=1 Tax=Alkaliphilus flagellatus TaxID=2841507 RepID=A0ABS6G097_9FIRM|nr:4Fe-4S cluster-binding domain-containing protein [Alkaliphilus flagellatus]MBU5675924.1 radical SAM protein [Alkaliphilus flagellatus]